VLGLEVSRPARNSSDWHQLFEIYALTGTLILGEDGLYDVTTLNDRLPARLKGTIMKESQFSMGQIVKILQLAERAEHTISSICREYDIRETTFYGWRSSMAAGRSTRPLA
jgi:hypothetical protein